MQTYPPGTRIGQFEITDNPPLKGGMGVVYFSTTAMTVARLRLKPSSLNCSQIAPPETASCAKVLPG
jgi:hypothetical protein